MEYQLKKEAGFTYLDKGQGEVLILLHGLMGSISNWTSVIEHFSGKYRVILPILPLYDMPLLATGVKTLSKTFAKFVDYLDLKDKFTIVGNSLGGHIGLIYSLHHPNKIASLVLTGSSGLYENAMGSSFPRRESYEYIKEKVAYTFYDSNQATKELVDEVFANVNDRHKVIKILAIAKSAIRHNIGKDLHKISLQVLIIWGKQDKVTPPHVAEEFHRILPHSELHFIDKCGHAPMMEQPEEFNNILTGFLQKQNFGN